MLSDMLRQLARSASWTLVPSAIWDKFAGNDIELLRSSHLFDADFYRATYPDIGPQIDPVKHYLRFGPDEGRQPSALFDAVAYLRDNPDVARARVNPLVHYLRFGQAEGRVAQPHVSPSLDMATMPPAPPPEVPPQPIAPAGPQRADEIREAIEQSGVFDAEFYRRIYPDIDAAGVDPLAHFIEHGEREGRRPNRLFDARYYASAYPEVQQSGLSPLLHYATIGKAANRYGSLHQLIEESGLFDPEFYRRTYPDIAAANIDPLDHFVEHGGREGRRPHAHFDPRWYATAYPDVRDSGLSPLVHYLTIGKPEGRSYRFDPRIMDSVDRMIAEAGSLESTILLEPAFAEPSLLSFNLGGQDWVGIHAWQDLFDTLDRPYDHIVFVPWLVRGGADLAAANAARAVIEAHGIDSTLVVLTDHECTDAIDWLPEGTHVRVFSNFGPTLSRADRSLMVEALILAVQPKSILNVNSGACWDAIVRRGGALGRATDIYACLFCRDYTPDGRAAGYSDTHFRDALPYLKKLYFDNEGFLNEMMLDAGVPPSLQAKMVTVYQPMMSSGAPLHAGGPRERNAVIWAGRFCTQKNVALLIDIVARAPEFRFDVYGYGDDQYARMLQSAAARHGNLRLMGPFRSTMALTLNDYTALLFTSLWEGLPLTLVDVASSGIPIVASAVGGIPELVTQDTGWLIPSYREVEPYVDALKQIQAEPELAKQKGARMRERVLSNHTWKRFTSMLAVPPSFIE
jgi:glycosyltransferase involved in cell wall biosynthesis